MHSCNFIAFRDGQSYPALDVTWDSLIERYPADDPLDPQPAGRVIQAALDQLLLADANSRPVAGDRIHTAFWFLADTGGHGLFSARSATPWTSTRASASPCRAGPRRLHLVEAVRQPPHVGRLDRHPLPGLRRLRSRTGDRGHLLHHLRERPPRVDEGRCPGRRLECGDRGRPRSAQPLPRDVALGHPGAPLTGIAEKADGALVVGGVLGRERRNHPDHIVDRRNSSTINVSKGENK
jgi:hypothetical protein